MLLETYRSGQATWNPKRIAATGGPHTYEELAGDGGNYYDGKPPVPPHAHDDSYSRPINGGKYYSNKHALHINRFNLKRPYYVSRLLFCRTVCYFHSNLLSLPLFPLFTKRT